MAKKPRWRNWFMQCESRLASWDDALSLARKGLGLGALEDRAMLATGVVASYAVVNDWGTGFQALLQQSNQRATSVANWQLEFDMARNITSIRDARIVSHVGNHYVI